MSKNVTFVFKPAQIDAAIESVAKSAATLKQKIHNVAVAITLDWQTNSGAKKITDEKALEAAHLAVDRLNRLQQASPYHANAFSKWVGMMTPCLWSDETKTWYVHVDSCRLQGKQFVEGRDKPFWEVSPPTPPKPFDMWNELQKIVDRAKKHGEKPVDGDVIDPAVIRELTTIVSKHNATAA